MCGLLTKNKSYCSRQCAEKGKFGRKRPDLIIRNKQPRSDGWRENQRISHTGKKQSEETKVKRSKKLKDYYATHPEAKAKLARNVWDKYTSKIAGTSWRKIRVEALERDSYKCQKCGNTKKRLIVHHIDWRGKRRNVPTSEWNNAMDNLITVCITCHNRIHRHKSSDYRQRYKEKIAP